jgi:hypothetical protein
MWAKVAAGTGVVLVAFALFVYVAHLPSVTIAKVSVSGTDLVSAEAVRAIALAKLSGSYGYLVPHANALVAPDGAIRSAVMAAFPPVASVSVTRKGFTEMDLAVTEREPSALWCAGDAPSEPAEASADCYLMDAGGFVYATSTPEEPFVRYYGGLSADPVGQTYLAGAFPDLSKVVSGVAASLNRTPAVVAVDAATPDVSLTFRGGGVLRFERSEDPASTIQNIASVFASQSLKDHPAFEYVDFRFGDKVYVKLK